MRRPAVAAAVATLLLSLFAAGTALAASSADVSADDVRLAKALKERGVIPAGATAAEAIVKSYIREKVGTKPVDRANKSGAWFIQGEYPGFGGNQHGWHNVDKAGTAVDKALVILVEFGGP